MAAAQDVRFHVGVTPARSTTVEINYGRPKLWPSELHKYANHCQEPNRGRTQRKLFAYS